MDRIVRGVTVAALLLLASDTLAQSLCADLDRVVTLARTRFWSIRDEANRGEFKTPVTRSLPGASECWYHDASHSYWCAWAVAPAERRSRVRRLARAVAACYAAQPAYDDGYEDEAIAFVRLPDATSIYINGVGETVAMSIAATLSLPEPYPQAP